MGDNGTDDGTSSRRYRLSFTVGGLLAIQGASISKLLSHNIKESEVEVKADEPLSGQFDDQLNATRKQAVEDNLLMIGTRSACQRITSETVHRLSSLTPRELDSLADEKSALNDRKMLMWVAMCRRYEFVGDFAEDVLRDHCLAGIPTVTYEDYHRFLLAKSMWHPELDKVSDATAKKLRSNLFQAMFEAGFLRKDDNTIVPALLTRKITALLQAHPDSFAYFPLLARL